MDALLRVFGPLSGIDLQAGSPQSLIRLNDHETMDEQSDLKPGIDISILTDEPSKLGEQRPTRGILFHQESRFFANVCSSPSPRCFPRREWALLLLPVALRVPWQIDDHSVKFHQCSVLVGHRLVNRW